MTVGSALHRRVGLALFLFLLALQALNYSGAPHSSDGLAMLATTESLARRGDLDMDAYRWMGLQQGTYGPDGELYSRKGLGQSLAALPLAWLSLRTGSVGLLQLSLLVSPLVAAATGWLLYHCLITLGFSVGEALATALALAVSTPLLPYGKHDFSDPLTGLALLAAFAAWLAYRRRPSAKAALAVGLGLGFAALTRTTSLALTPVFGLAIWLGRPNPLAPFPKKEGGGEASLSAWERGWGRGLRRRFRHLVAFALGLAALVALSGWFNYLRFGNPLTSGYLAEESFSGDWLAGVAGLLISPGRGLFLYAPVLLLALFGWRELHRRHSDVSWVAAALVAAHVLIYGKWFMWHGGYCWGPRFLAPALPFLALGLAPLWDRGRVWRAAFLALAALGLGLNLVGCLTHFAPFQDDLLATGLPLFDPRTFWEPRYSPLIGQWRYLSLSPLDFAWAADGTIDVLSLVALLASLGLTLLALCSSMSSREGSFRPPLPAQGRGQGGLGDSPGRRTRPARPNSFAQPALLVVVAIAVSASLGFTLVRAHGVGSHPVDARLSRIQEREAAGDSLITTDPADASLVSDRYRGVLPAYSLPNAEDALLAELLTRYRRLWVLEGAAASPVAHWLDEHAFPVLDESADDRGLRLYAAPPAAPTVIAANVDLRDGITLEQAAAALEGDTLLVSLTWRATAVPSHSYKVFVHALDADGALMAQSDAVPAAWLRPTDTWSPGAAVVDRHGLLLPPGVTPGALRLGLYALDDGTPLLLEGGAAYAEVAFEPG